MSRFPGHMSGDEPFEMPKIPPGPAMGSPRVEPRSDLRQAAAGLMEMFVALKDAGFTEHQALIIIGHMMSGGQKGGGE
ncbi:hypothetical protein ACFORO_12405 [Amycolatopsis halotolerans]|uniref:Uncharacterized protein n=1 Tax=Amycolatopsis halotolerans TaxID=330083 RepID=A0ABV7QGH1_9PSEU